MGIELVKLRKTFNGHAAIECLDVSVGAGEMLVLLGPSGCGKTTTMRCVAGLENPDSGRVEIGGRTVFDDRTGVNVPINQRNTGMVFQSYAIWPHMTVAENVAFPLVMARCSRGEIDARVKEILSLVGLDGFADRGASYMSGGQMQRVALARSLVSRPAVLLFDEPLSNLDARLRDHLRVQLREIQTRLAITSVYVTHDQREALAVADRIAVMRRGSILQIDDPVSIYTNPRTRTVADFLGYSNIFPASEGRVAGAGFEVALAGGHRLVASRAPASPAGALFACVRPEDLRVRAAETSARCAVNAIAGEVLLGSFMGNYIQYRVRVAGGAVWDAFDPDIANRVAIGERVTMEVPPENVLLLPE